MVQLTKDDIKTLFEALDALPKSKQQSNALSGIFGAIFSKDDEDCKDKWQEHHKKETEKMEEENRVLEERIVLLKAKLIQMKDQMIVQEAIG